MKLAGSHTPVSDSSEPYLHHYNTQQSSAQTGAVQIAFKLLYAILSTIRLLESVTSQVQKSQYIMAHVFCNLAAL